MIKATPKRKTMSNSERQRKHRAKAKQQHKRRIDMYVSTSTAVNLETMAKYYSMSKIQMIEKLIADKTSELMQSDSYNQFLDEILAED